MDDEIKKIFFNIESPVSRLLIYIIKFSLLVYDVISLPIYFLIQRPDRRAREAQRERSERVDARTWIKTDPKPNGTRHLLQDHGFQARTILPHKYMGATLTEIFANAVDHYKMRVCLGYRAVVRAPALGKTTDDNHRMNERSFRSDFTWYTYQQIGLRVQDIASGLHCLSQVRAHSRVMFLASTSLDWFCASQAALQLAAEIVLAPDIEDICSLKLIIEESHVSVIFVSLDRLLMLESLLANIQTDPIKLSHYALKKIIVIDWQPHIDFEEPTFRQLRDSSHKLIDRILSMGQIEEAGAENPIELMCTKALDYDQLYEDIEITTQRKISTRTLEMKRQLREEKLSQRRTSETHNRKLFNMDSHQLKQNHWTRGTRGRLSPLGHDSMAANRARPKPDDLAMIVYRKNPLVNINPMDHLKAVLLSHSYLARSNQYLFLDGMITENDIHCTTLPLDNVTEFMTEMCVFSHGGSIGYSSDSGTLFYGGRNLFKKDKSDLEALGPTFLLVRPFILEQLCRSLHNYLINELNTIKSFIMIHVLSDYKKFWARRHFGCPIVDRMFCYELRKLFGSNLKYLLCDGLTDCSETRDFFSFMINVPVIELYGPVESVVSLMSVNDIWDYKRRSQGRRTGLWWCDLSSGVPKMKDQDEEHQKDFMGMQLMPPKVNRNEFKLDSGKNLLITSSILCPTLGSRIRLENWDDFRITDRPYPRGRLVIGGEVVCKGYYEREQLTEVSFYKDTNKITWFRTNDIARVFPNGSFELISGIGDMIKMMDGQFISLSQIEHILRNSQFVDNVCAICGDDRKFLIALVVPNLKRLALKSLGDGNDLKLAIGAGYELEELKDVDFRREVCNDRLLCDFVNIHLGKLLAKAGFQSLPKRFHMVAEIWTPDTGLVTPGFEPKRQAIQRFYADDIQSIFGTEFSLIRDRLSMRLRRRMMKLTYGSKPRHHSLTTGRLIY